MKLINNILLVIWALAEWAVFLILVGPIACLAFVFPGTILIMGLVEVGPVSLLYVVGYLLLGVAVYTYRHSPVFWASPIRHLGPAMEGGL